MSAMARETWHWEFSHSPAEVWPLIADTVRFNEAAGFARYPVEERPQPDGSVRYFGHSRIGGFSLAWEEIPSNWIENRWLTHERVFSRGPFRRVKVLIHLTPTSSGCDCAYTLEVEPANLLGHLVLRTGFFRNTEKKFRTLIEQFRRSLREPGTEPFQPPPPRLLPAGAERCQALAGGLADSPYSHGLETRIAHWILQRPDSDVHTIRPKVLARAWGVAPDQAMELCLLAAHRGLLSLRWDLLCPNCRVGKASNGSLDRLPSGSHCGTCNIDYDRDFNRNVELVFSPAAFIRPTPLGEYCLFGPRSTPHILAQLQVGPGKTRQEECVFPPGLYRLRTMEPGPFSALDLSSGEGVRVVITAQGHIESPTPDSSPSLRVENHSARPRTLIVESRAWMTDILTAAEAVNLAAFRDLFHAQVLRPGDYVQIDHAVLLFTDLQASASLYESMGDAAAYALVREHFAVLARCIRQHGGTVVKTIGDAVMAAFSDPREGLRCALAVPSAIAAFHAHQTPAHRTGKVKLGLHAGPCLAVTINGILDYFGRTANLASRLASLSHGGDVVLSRSFSEDPAIPPLMVGLPREDFVAEAKGFSQPISCVRLTPPYGALR